LEGNSGVGVDGDSHTNVSSNDGCDGSNKVGHGSVWEVSWVLFVVHLKHIDGGAEYD